MARRWNRLPYVHMSAWCVVLPTYLPTYLRPSASLLMLDPADHETHGKTTHGFMYIRALATKYTHYAITYPPHPPPQLFHIKFPEGVYVKFRFTHMTLWIFHGDPQHGAGHGVVHTYMCATKVCKQVCMYIRGYVGTSELSEIFHRRVYTYFASSDSWAAFL